MKKLILSELLLLFLATTFISDNPPGWYQLTLPVSKQVNDIYFLDSLTGWVVASNISYPVTDTGYILKTTNGGNNWTIQLDSMFNYYAVQFVDMNNGYVAGGTGRAKFLKTTNGGINWTVTTPFGSSMYAILDISFVNKDTGWICSNDSFGGGIYKTTNGGINWQQQLSAGFRPKKLFFINSDTGWAGSDEANGKLYRTTNGGQVWEWQYTTNIAVNSIFFLNGLKGWIRAGGGNGVAYTTNGGINWTSAQGEFSGSDLRFVNDSIGYSGNIDFKVTKSSNGGRNWGYQISPIFNNLSVSMIRTDTTHGWAGGNGLVKTTDGGGPILDVKKINSQVPSDFKLYQNYPNPFNPITKIKYQIANSKEQIPNMKLVIYSVQGKEVITLVNEQQRAGTYEVDFDGSAYSSGVYFYQLTVSNKQSAVLYRETRKMILLK